VTAVTGKSFERCLQVVTDDMSKLSAVKYFGNFIDARWALDERILVEKGTLQNQDEGDKWQSRLQSYESTIFQPAFTFAQNYRQELKLSSSSLFSLLAHPSDTDSALRTQLDDLTKAPFVCHNGKGRDEMLYDLLCDKPDSSDDVALTLLSRPILAELTVEIADWIKIIAQMADVYDQSGPGGFYKTVEEMIERKDTSASPGKEMIRKSISVLDVAIASYNEMYGGFTATAVAVALQESDMILSAGAKTPAERDAAWATWSEIVKLLRNNPYLADNVMMVDLKRVGYVPESLYRLSLNAAVRDQAPLNFDVDTSNFFLNELFPHLFFESGPAPGVRYVAGEDEILVNAPPPDRFAKGGFVFPPRFYDLLRARDELAERLADYDILSTTKPEMREELAKLLLQ
jgi:hypothetical protein